MAKQFLTGDARRHAAGSRLARSAIRQLITAGLLSAIGGASSLPDRRQKTPLLQTRPRNQRQRRRDDRRSGVPRKRRPSPGSRNR